MPFHRRAISTPADADFPGKQRGPGGQGAATVLSLIPSQLWANHIVTFCRCPRFAQLGITGSFISQVLQGLCGYLFHLSGSQALFSIDRPSNPQSR